MFLKHVGKHNDRKVAIVFREVPGEEHMALVVYPEVLPSAMHDSLMKVIESPEGQAAESLGDVLFRSLFTDGQAMLQSLHKQGMIKKVQTETVKVTPTPSSSCQLSELNKILNEIKSGEAAHNRLKELDASAGISGKQKTRDAMGKAIAVATSANNTSRDVLSDTSIASSLRAQAANMVTEANGLLAESSRLEKEANLLEPAVTAKKRGPKPKVLSEA
jgi:hypothetical protein